MSEAIDLTVMRAMHGALRREVAHLDRFTTAADRDPGRVLATAAGWTLFKQALLAHHAAEDEALWPALRQSLAGRPKELGRLEVMEAEHVAIAAVIRAIDELLTEPGADPLRLGELTDALTRGLAGHLKHEEDTALPLIRPTLSTDQWAHFCQVHARHIGQDATRLLPWLLEGADQPTVRRLLAQLPAHVYAACTVRWIPAYTAFDRWSPGSAL
ncbi:hemerythrin domain-containing protein [Streptomyces sp. NPDC054854]